MIPHRSSLKRGLLLPGDPFRTQTGNSWEQCNYPGRLPIIGSPVAVLEDESGLGNIAFQNSGALQPISENSQQVGRVGLSFDASSFLFCSVDIAQLTQGFYFSALINVDPSSAGTDYIWDQSPGRNGAGLLYRNNQQSLRFIYYENGSTQVRRIDTPNGSVIKGQTYHVGIRIGPNGSSLYLNGVQSAFRAGPFPGFAPNTSSATLRVGSRESTNSTQVRNGFRGLLGEFIFIEGEINELERQRVEGYTCHRAKRQDLLPLTHPHKNEWTPK